MTSLTLSTLLKAQRPSPAAGVLLAAAGVTLATLLIYPLKHLAPVVSLGVVYLLAVVAVSTFWGLRLGIATGLASAAAFNFFHLRPVGLFTLSDSREWVSLSAFTVVAVATGMVGELARTRAQEADERRHEADVSAELAQLLLAAARPEEALAAASERLAAALGVRSAWIELGDVASDEERIAFPLHGAGTRVGTLLLPGEISEPERARVSRRIVPSLESILAASRHRAELQAEVVETAALRRSDEIKTAVLRSVSHDLRTPVTAILTAITALDPDASSPEKVAEVRDVVTSAATRLARLIEKVLDLSVLQAGRAQPRSEWCSIEEVLHEAVDQVAADQGTADQGTADGVTADGVTAGGVTADGVTADRALSGRAAGGGGAIFRLSLERGMPLLRGDPSQLERAFANVLENSARHRAEKQVLVRAKAVNGRIRVRIVDQGPGIPPSEQERIFLPFYRSANGDSSHEGSGLGLAIAKGFIEASGGRIWVESTPPSGTSFVVELQASQAEGDPGARAGSEADPPQTAAALGRLDR